MDAQPLFAASGSKVDRSTIESAVNALITYKDNQSASQKPQLLPQDDYIYLNLTLKKIPTNPPTNPLKIPLPHPLFDSTSELCLIIDDRPHSPTPPSEDIKKLIKSQSIPVSKVLKISKLKANYKPFEAKRKLCDSYDLFLVDKRVVHLLPKLLGKQFFKKKKLPLGVDLSKKNLKAQVERSLGSALLYLRTGTCCVMRAGKVSMEKEEIVENIVSVVEAVAERVPKKWNGVRSLHLKFSDSIALPIYQALPDMKLKIEGMRESKKGVEEVKMDDNENEEKESGRKEGGSGKKKKRGRIHEVRYMDVGDELMNDENEVEDQAKMNDGDDEQKGKEVDLMEENSEDDDLIGNKLGGNIRKKKKAVKARDLSNLDEEKEMKRKAKTNRGAGKPKKDGLEVDLMEQNSEDDNLGGNELGGNERKKKRALKARDASNLDEEKEMKRKAKTNRGSGKPKKDGLEVDLMEENIEDDNLGGNELGGNERKKKRAVKARDLSNLDEEKEMEEKAKTNRGAGKPEKDGSGGKKGLRKTENKKEAREGNTKAKDAKSKKRVSTK